MSVRKTKLRDSCDACGAAKIKCDRQQPSCGRCQQKGTSCVYGICRRTGKIGASASRNVNNNGANVDSCTTMMNEEGWSLEEAMDMPLNLDLLPTPPNETSPSQTSANDGTHFSLHATSPTATTDGDLFGAFLQQHPFMSSGSGDSTRRPPSSPTTDDFTDMSSISNPTQDYYAMLNRQLPLHDGFNFGGIVLDPDSTFGTEKHQHCTQEAYNILGDLMFARYKEETTAISSNPAAQQQPLDMILQVNRRATERLRALSTCSCIRAPGLAVVYALAISRILEAYQKAADTMFQLSLPGTQQQDITMPRSSSIASLSSLSEDPHLPAEDAMDHDSDMFLLEDDASSGKISVGSFVVDDNQAKVALSLQLLSIEVQRVKSLTSLFVRGGHAMQTDTPFTDTCDDLEQNLRLWIRREYMRTANLVKSRSMSLCI